ncbi:hypothetical protein [Streptomyces sp. NPDC058989]|uniref:hypothetical protein n=1 Tax=Streptomyces sp. NPDC058989 TaxID=3346686 RepID=UPI0036A8CE27
MRWIGWGLLVIVLLASAVFVMKGLTAAGLTGTHGTFTVKECTEEAATRRSNKPTNEFSCVGVFRPDDGSTVDDKASLDSFNKDYDAGTSLSVQHNDAGVLGLLTSGYLLADGAQVSTNFLCAFGVLLYLPVALFVSLTGFGSDGVTFRRFRETWDATRGTRTRTIVLTSTIGVLVGMFVVSTALGHVLPGLG